LTFSFFLANKLCYQAAIFATRSSARYASALQDRAHRPSGYEPKQRTLPPPAVSFSATLHLQPLAFPRQETTSCQAPPQTYAHEPARGVQEQPYVSIQPAHASTQRSNLQASPARSARAQAQEPPHIARDDLCTRHFASCPSTAAQIPLPAFQATLDCFPFTSQTRPFCTPREPHRHLRRLHHTPLASTTCPPARRLQHYVVPTRTTAPLLFTLRSLRRAECAAKMNRQRDTPQARTRSSCCCYLQAEPS